MVSVIILNVIVIVSLDKLKFNLFSQRRLQEEIFRPHDSKLKGGIKHPIGLEFCLNDLHDETLISVHTRVIDRQNGG